MLHRRLAPAAAGIAAVLLLPAVAAATSTGPCTATAQTPRGNVDLSSAAVLHVLSTDDIVFSATAPTAQDRVNLSLEVLGYPVSLVDASKGSGSGGSSGTFTFDVSTLASYGRSAQVSAISSGPSGPCTVTVQIVIDDLDPLSTPLGLVASVGAGAGAVALAAGLLLPLAIGPMLIVAGLLLLAAGGSTVLQQLALPVDPRLGTSAMAASLPSPVEVLRDPITIGLALLGAVLVAILMPFPSELFNRTVEKNRDEIRSGFSRIPLLGRLLGTRSSPADPPGSTLLTISGDAVAVVEEKKPFWQRGFVGGVLSLAIAGLLSAALDPAFGPNVHTALAWLASAVAIWVVLNTANLPARAVQRRVNGDRGEVEMVVGALPIAILGVVISRVVGYLPGYLYGVILVWAFTRELAGRDDARTAERGAWWMLILAASSWLMLNSARAGTIEGSVPGLILTTALAAVTVAGVEAIVFAMLPIGEMAGAKVFRVSRLRWAVLYAAGLLAFILVILNPENGFAEAPDQVSFVTAVGLFVGFGLFSIAFWAFFQLRHRQAAKTPSNA